MSSKFEISDDADELNQEIDDTNFPTRSNSISFGVANGNGSTGSLNNSYGPFANRRRSSSIRRTESEMTEEGENGEGEAENGGHQQQQQDASMTLDSSHQRNNENGENGSSSVIAPGGLNRARPTPIRTTSLSGEMTTVYASTHQQSVFTPPPLHTPRATMTPAGR